ncbi:uncharacterized protein LOC129566206 [Sitodiplosis mosellana]|uniref:uncharacterized protein LOC129566206 n=1 Tax=Sitodiplosis mosellana TaxID=263140 RepID=UPI0024437ABF|nr:uncharacterized protein LOC129566206 [Sitodiplosis mosellana]
MAQSVQHKYDDFGKFVSECKNFVKSIENYTGNDRLINWYEYLLWIDENFITDFENETIFNQILAACLVQFEHEERYTQDRRLVKLFIKYIHFQEEPNTHYEAMISKGIGVKVADLYINWAFYFDDNRDFEKANEIFKRGLKAEAQPMDLLKSAHEEFMRSMKQRALHGTSEEYQRDTHNRLERIATLRIFGASLNQSKSSALNQFDKSTLMNVCIPNTVSPNHSTPEKCNTLASRNITDSVETLRMRIIRNNRIPVCMCDADFGSSYTCQPCRDRRATSIRLGHDFKSKNLPQTQSPGLPYFDPPKASFNDIWQQMVPGYDKIMMTPADNVAFSAEELRAYQWFKHRRIENAFTKKQDKIWGIGYDVPMRWADVFPRKNLTQSEWIVPRVQPSEELNEKGPHTFMCNMGELYPKNSMEEYSLEEIIRIKRESCAKGGNTTRGKVFSDQPKTKPASGAIQKMRFGKTSTRNKPVPNRPKGLGDDIFKQQMEIARAMNRVKNVKPKALLFADEDKENIFIPENLQHLNTPAAQRKTQFDFWENAQAFAGIESDGYSAAAASDTSSTLKLTTSVEEDMATVQDMITNVWNAIGNNLNDSPADPNVRKSIKQPVDCSTPIKKPAHNYSFSYELLETTAEFERLEALCSISPVKGSSPVY